MDNFLKDLENKFKQNEIYVSSMIVFLVLQKKYIFLWICQTSIGKVVIAVNPNKLIDDLYSKELLKMYHDMDNLPAHVYSVGEFIALFCEYLKSMIIHYSIYSERRYPWR